MSFNYQCRKCGDTGALLAKRKSDGYLFAFRCDCYVGENDKRKYPEWKNQTNFEVIEK